MNQAEIIQKAQENLPKPYASAIRELGITNRIDTIGAEFELTDEQITLLDQEVIYLLLYITNSPEFTERIADKLDVSNDTLLEIINAVTNKVLKPLASSIAGIKQATTASMPVPPPPPVPGSGYGGTSDPYREPTDSN